MQNQIIKGVAEYFATVFIDASSDEQSFSHNNPYL